MLTIQPEEFFEAIKNGDITKANDLITRDPELVNSKSKTGSTGILYALYTAHPDVAELIAQRKKTLDIFEAASLGKLSQVEQLIKQRSDQVFAYSDEGFTALQLAAYLGQRETVKFLLKTGAEVNAV